MYAYKMGVDGTGRPQFTLAGKSAATYSGKSVPTITTLNGQPGTGIVSEFIPFACVGQSVIYTIAGMVSRYQ